MKDTRHERSGLRFPSSACNALKCNFIDVKMFSRYNEDDNQIPYDSPINMIVVLFKYKCNLKITAVIKAQMMLNRMAFLHWKT